MRSSIGSRGSAERPRPDRSPVVPTLAAVKDVLILGSTGSIGEQAIDVVGRSADLRIAGLSAGSSWEQFHEAFRYVEYVIAFGVIVVVAGLVWRYVRRRRGTLDEPV